MGTALKPLLLFSCGCISFVVLGLYIRKRERPMWIWTSDIHKLSKTSVTDVKTYNRAVSRLYFTLALVLLLFGLTMCFYPFLGIILFAVMTVPGIGAFVLVGERINKKYRVQ